jgi:anti-anti-sigma regulatory factor
LNLADFKQVDSTGVRAIVDTYVSLGEDGELKLLCPRGSVLEVFRVLRLLEIIPSFDDETQALASFRPQSNAAAN